MIEKRIAYYTKKVALYGDRRTPKGKNRYRFERLMNYKKAVDRRLFQ